MIGFVYRYGLITGFNSFLDGLTVGFFSVFLGKSSGLTISISFSMSLDYLVCSVSTKARSIF